MDNIVTASEVRARLALYLNQAEQGTATVISRNGVPVAALVPLGDFQALEDAADALLAREAETVRAEGGPTASLEELVAELSDEEGSYFC
ncbi:type II toxin-antitoxin system Phd/YefM family antitoxin [Streptomyces gamaensis]|uniref:Antitoxin n=1 Tax=Streptomyces gamaensis TaxID=1763542 RepID=A0ABW0YU93_9ACTN